MTTKTSAQRKTPLKERKSVKQHRAERPTTRPRPDTGINSTHQPNRRKQMTKRTYVMSEQTKTIMDVVNKCGADGIKAKDVAERLQLEPLIVSNTLASLLKSKHIFAHTKGVRYYKALKYKPVIKASTVERHIPSGDFFGVDWSHSTQRPGCQDHTAIPSRVGDRIVPYKAPGLICTGVLADKSNHTRD